MFFNYLASFANLHITAYDQRGHGRTSQAPLTSSSPEVKKWKAEGKPVKVEKNGKRRTGGWGKVFGDMEWFLKGENARAGGKPLFLWGFSMVGYTCRNVLGGGLWGITNGKSGGWASTCFSYTTDAAAIERGDSYAVGRDCRWASHQAQQPCAGIPSGLFDFLAYEKIGLTR